jgi:hypothetical protein
MFTHDSTCSAAKQAVMTANACKFLHFRMTARAKGWMFVLLSDLPGMQIASMAPYYVKIANNSRSVSGSAVFIS